VNGIHISHDLLGDALAMLAAILYGLTDTIAEYSIKHIDRVEYLGILGLFGSMWTALLLVWLEGRQFVAFFWSGSRVAGFETAVATMLWYIGSLLAYYLSASFFLETSDATLLNLSLQAANLWSILVSVLMYQNIPAFGFYVAVILVVSGVVVYECGKLPIAIPSTRSTLQAVTTDSLKAKPQHGAESRACRHYETI
jgi:solute carrier family 35 protein F1/2